MEKDKILLKIKEIMEKHKGERNFISAGKIAEMLNLKQEDTHIEPRVYIYETIKKYRMPIAGGNRGYYMITNQEELEKYINSLENRIRKIEERKQEIQTIFNEYYNQQRI